jgi:hypothetical protein
VKRSTALVLFGLVLLAALVRVTPLLRAVYWGSDFGEYYALTRALVQDGVVPAQYGGWGVTYPYFPGLFVVNGAFALAGVPVDAVLVLLTPLLGALAILPVFLLAARVTGDDLAALVSAGFLAVVMLHVYATSHTVPATLGDVLLVGSLLMFVNIRRSPKFLPLAIATALAAIVTHHLATYVLLLAAAASILLRAVLDSKITVRGVRYELAFLIVVVTATLAYWGTYASRLWDLILANSPLSTTALFAGAALSVALVVAAVALRPRLRWRYRPRSRSVRAAWTATGLAVITSFAIVGIAVAGAVPGTTIGLPPITLAIFAPTFLFLSIAAAGRRTMDFAREGTDVTAWFAALVASVAVGVTLAPSVLIPYRHLEYLAIPVAVMVGAGARWLALRVETPVQRVVAVGLVGILAASAAAVSVPPPVALAGFDEGVNGPSATSVLWIRESAGGLVAGDHRLSSALFGFGGVDGTWDREDAFWHEANTTAALDAMRSVRVGAQSRPVDWVLLDDALRKGVQTSPFEPALPLTAAEAAKFEGPPFFKLYDGGSAQAYWLNWGLAR